MFDILILIAGLGLVVQAFVGLTFFVSSIWEKEVRASILAGLQFLVMLGLLLFFFWLNSIEFFDTVIGRVILTLGLILGVAIVILFTLRIGSNPRALTGTQGLVTENAKRFDGRGIPMPGMDMTSPAPPGAAGPPPGMAGPPPGATDPPTGKLAGAPPSGMGAPPPETGAGPGIAMSGPPPEGMPSPPAGGIPPDFNPAAMLKMIFGDTMCRIDRPHEGPNMAAGIASFVYTSTMGFTQFSKPKPSEKALSMIPKEATERIKGFAKALGADLVGVAELNPLWAYSHHGMSFNIADIGKEINVDHQYAIVFGEEMEFDLVATGPHTPTNVETGIKYAKGTFIATQIANFIAQMGYTATANSMPYYEACMVPLAVDAGLGECARSGSLITKELGMRLRLSAVTTSIPLVPDKPVDIGVEDFCSVCKKCAHTCPSNSIKHGEIGESDGFIRWKHNGKTCGERWLETGTDCAICMRVCPWSHARTFPPQTDCMGRKQKQICPKII